MVINYKSERSGDAYAPRLESLLCFHIRNLNTNDYIYQRNGYIINLTYLSTETIGIGLLSHTLIKFTIYFITNGQKMSKPQAIIEKTPPNKFQPLKTNETITKTRNSQSKPRNQLKNIL